MGFIDDIFRMKRKSDRFVNTIEKLEQSSRQRALGSLKSQLYRGEITATEFESYFEDSDTAIQALVEDVDGIGPSTSKNIAREYISVAEFLRTDRGRLESISGVGPSTAESVIRQTQNPRYDQ